jgi:hypothetical protein
VLTIERPMTDWERLKQATTVAVLIAGAGIVTVITILYLIFGG